MNKGLRILFGILTACSAVFVILHWLTFYGAVHGPVDSYELSWLVFFSANISLQVLSFYCPQNRGNVPVSCFS